MTAKRTAGEFNRCGMQLEGPNACEMGVCPASTYVWFDGVHGGKNAGRRIISGTMCNGEVQGKFAEKFKICGKCAFYNSVKKEEGGRMVPSMPPLEKMEGNK